MAAWYNDIFSGIETFLTFPGHDGKKPVTQQMLARRKNDIVFQNVFVQLVNTARSRYDIEGYPDTMSGRVLRDSLLYHGRVFAFKKWGKTFALPGVPYGMPNFNGDFAQAWIVGRNGFNESVNLYVPGGYDREMFMEYAAAANEEPTAVMIRENFDSFPFIRYCIEFAGYIADAFRILDTNRHHMKTPYFIFAEDQSLPTIKKTMDMIADNVEFVVGTGVFDPTRVSLLPTGVGSDLFKGTTDLIEWYYNKFFEKCGLHANSNPDKKERLTTIEVTAGDEPTKQQQANLFDYLQEQLDFANECLGTEMKVVFLEKEGEDEVQQLDPNAGPGAMAASGGDGGED